MFFSMVRILKWLPNLIEATFRREEKSTHPDFAEVLEKKF
jgi:hypothetical protein